MFRDVTAELRSDATWPCRVELDGRCWESVEATRGPSDTDRDIAVFDVARRPKGRCRARWSLIARGGNSVGRQWWTCGRPSRSTTNTTEIRCRRPMVTRSWTQGWGYSWCPVWSGPVPFWMVSFGAQ